MPSKTLRILCVHGIGNHHSDLGWQRDWSDAIRASVQRTAGDALTPIVEFTPLDDIFADYPITAAESAAAVAELSASWVWHGVGDLFRRRRGMFDGLSDRARWTAGMIVQWTRNAELRRRLRERLMRRAGEFSPHIVAGHSLGSLVAYEAGTLDGLAGALLTFGSQVGHPAVRRAFAGRIATPPNIERWFHLYNRNDHVFTYPIDVNDGRFRQLDAVFDVPSDVLNHNATWYLGHEETATVWNAFAPEGGVRAFATATAAEARREPLHRALIVGIDEYANPANNLGGCVNDAYLASAALQENGFQADNVRMVLNERATANGIRERIEWLLEDPKDGDVRWLHYSGHGARLPAYNEAEIVDHMDECLVPYDFDWSHEKAIVDDWFFELYSQLPYGLTFVAVFDCCHSGGMTRAGAVKARGLAPPDDIRHRMLRWDSAKKMWAPRRYLEPAAKKAGVGPRFEQLTVGYAGEEHSISKLGVAAELRDAPREQIKTEAAKLGHRGPYMPVLFQACQEHELAEEYTHGNQSYGIFTYCLCHRFREIAAGAGKPPTPNALVQEVKDAMQTLEYKQVPQVVGPRGLLDAAMTLPTIEAARKPAARAVKPTKKRRPKGK